MQLGKTIVKIRKEYELTQEDFAKKFNVTRQTVSNWENEKSYPDLITLIKISDEFGYSLDAMLKENPDMTEDMNENIKMAKILIKMYEKRIVTAIIGAIACLIMAVISFITYDVVAMIIWIVALLVNVYTIVTYKLIKKNKAKKDIY